MGSVDDMTIAEARPMARTNSTMTLVFQSTNQTTGKGHVGHVGLFQSCHSLIHIPSEGLQFLYNNFQLLRVLLLQLVSLL
mmetsp:Transcript_1686/g.3223  ORF Transcript_1686/g.3223 Transcript_1686/m.3223 type:complete len:80 (-) Transcript_1686:221-460(-)